MREEDKQYITYRKQRYQRKEREIEITLDTKDEGKEVLVEDMGEP